MSISVYRKLNKNWMADVALNSIRRTETFDKKIDATNWARFAEPELILNAATEFALVK